MRRRCPRDSRLAKPLAKAPVDMPPCDAHSSTSGEEGACLAVGEVPSQVPLDLGAEEHHVGPVALGAPELDFGLVQVNVIDIEGDGRSDANASPKHQPEEHAIALGLLAPGLVENEEETPLVLLAEGPWWGRRASSATNQTSRVVGDVAGAMAMTEERLDR